MRWRMRRTSSPTLREGKETQNCYFTVVLTPGIWDLWPESTFFTSFDLVTTWNRKKTGSTSQKCCKGNKYLRSNCRNKCFCGTNCGILWAILISVPIIYDLFLVRNYSTSDYNSVFFITSVTVPDSPSGNTAPASANTAEAGKSKKPKKRKWRNRFFGQLEVRLT